MKKKREKTHTNTYCKRLDFQTQAKSRDILTDFFFHLIKKRQNKTTHRTNVQQRIIYIYTSCNIIYIGIHLYIEHSYLKRNKIFLKSSLCFIKKLFGYILAIFNLLLIIRWERERKKEKKIRKQKQEEKK